MHLGYVIGWQNRNFCCEGKNKIISILQQHSESTKSMQERVSV